METPHNEEIQVLGQKAYASGNYVEALRHFVQAANTEPENLRIREQIGSTLQALGRADEAIQMFKKTAQGYLTQGSIIKAIAVHKAILAINPNDQEVKNQLVSIFGTDLPNEIADVIKTKPAEMGPPLNKGISAADLGLEDLENQDLPQSPEHTDQLHNVFAEILGENAELKDFGKVPSSTDPHAAFLRTPLFSELKPEELNSIIDKVDFLEFKPGDYICREGEAGHELWIIVQGKVEIKTSKKDGTEVYLASLSEGDFFGEGGFVNGAPRSASVVAKTPVKALTLSRASFDEVASKYPHMKEVMGVFYQNRLTDRAMAQSELFGQLPTFRRAELMQSFVRKTFQAGETLLEKDDEEGNFYFIESGKVGLFRGNEVFEHLKPGDFCGEGPAILKKPLSYQAKAIDETHALMLRKIEVEGIRQMFPESEVILKRSAKDRDKS